MFTTAKNLSPFDVNMAVDAGWLAAIPYINVEPDEVCCVLFRLNFIRRIVECII
jgi:hypothetical protein